MQTHPLLPEHKVVPFWTLPDAAGNPFNFARQRGRAHIVLLVAGPQSDPAPFLHDLAPHMSELRALPGQAIAVVASTEQAAAVTALPLTVVIDHDQKVFARYVPSGAAVGLFILDRYGALYHQWLVAHNAALPPAGDVVDWITAVSMQCSV